MVAALAAVVLALPQAGQGTETLLATYRELNAADLAHAEGGRRQRGVDPLEAERVAAWLEREK